MGEDRKGEILSVSEGGVSGEHAAAEPFAFLVGSTTADEFNTARLRLIPIACLRVDDIRFAFDSSFVSASSTIDPDGRVDNLTELQYAARLVKDHPGCPLSVFGHADPVGSDDYNKLLSGRRAMAIYGLLIIHGEPDSAVKLWQQISATEHWGADQRKKMLSFTDLPSNTPDNTLIRSYMQMLCPPDLKLTKKDFLGQGADSGGKGDYQGCGEFNPLLLFSREKQAAFDEARQRNDEAGITKRNSDNAPNRRVMVLMFRKGSIVSPAKWPCPNASESVAGCRKRFFSDGESRRTTHLLGTDRLFEKTKDTFACRFYQRISDNSPCDSLPKPGTTINFQTVDEFGFRVANSTLILTCSDGTRRKVTSDARGFHKESAIPEGEVRITLPDGATAKYIFEDKETDAVIDTRNLTVAIVNLVVLHQATPEQRRRRKELNDLYLSDFHRDKNRVSNRSLQGPAHLNDGPPIEQ